MSTHITQYLPRERTARARRVERRAGGRARARRARARAGAHGWMPRKLGAYGAGEDLEASNFDVAARRARDKRKATRTEHAHKVSCAVLVRIACSARTRRDATTCCPIPLHQRGRAHVEVTDRAARYIARCDKEASTAYQHRPPGRPSDGRVI